MIDFGLYLLKIPSVLFISQTAYSRRGKPIICDVMEYKDHHEIEILYREQPRIGSDILNALIKIKPIDFMYYDLVDRVFKTITLNEIEKIYMENYYMTFVYDSDHKIDVYYNAMADIEMVQKIGDKFVRKTLINIITRD